MSTNTTQPPSVPPVAMQLPLGQLVGTRYSAPGMELARDDASTLGSTTIIKGRGFITRDGLNPNGFFDKADPTAIVGIGTALNSDARLTTHCQRYLGAMSVLHVPRLLGPKFSPNVSFPVAITDNNIPYFPTVSWHGTQNLNPLTGGAIFSNGTAGEGDSPSPATAFIGADTAFQTSFSGNADSSGPRAPAKFFLSAAIGIPDLSLLGGDGPNPLVGANGIFFFGTRPSDNETAQYGVIGYIDSNNHPCIDVITQASDGTQYVSSYSSETPINVGGFFFALYYENDGELIRTKVVTAIPGEGNRSPEWTIDDSFPAPNGFNSLAIAKGSNPPMIGFGSPLSETYGSGAVAFEGLRMYFEDIGITHNDPSALLLTEVTIARGLYTRENNGVPYVNSLTPTYSQAFTFLPS